MLRLVSKLPLLSGTFVRPKFAVNSRNWLHTTRTKQSSEYLVLKPSPIWRSKNNYKITDEDTFKRLLSGEGLKFRRGN